MIKQITEDQELLAISGGINISGTIINAIVAGAKIILEIGRSFGSALRRTTSNDLCE